MIREKSVSRTSLAVLINKYFEPKKDQTSFKKKKLA